MKYVVAAAVAVGLIGGASMATERSQQPEADASYPLESQHSEDNNSEERLDRMETESENSHRGVTRYP